MHKLDPSVKTLWSLSLMLVAFLLAIGVFFYELFSIGSEPIVRIYRFGVLTAIVFVVGLIYSVVVPILRYRYWRFEIRDEELYVQHGVVTRVWTIAPIRRIQHLDVSQSIVENMLGLGKLIIYTAGTRGADIVIPGLPIEYAKQLRDQLKNYSFEDAV